MVNRAFIQSLKIIKDVLEELDSLMSGRVLIRTLLHFAQQQSLYDYKWPIFSPIIVSLFKCVFHSPTDLANGNFSNLASLKKMWSSVFAGSNGLR